MATYEGKWRCERCSNANLGRHLHCQTCGMKRDDNVQFFLDDENAVVTDAELLRQANAGADWICQYCGGGNRAFDKNCTSCGSAGSAENKQLQEETRGVNDWTESAQRAAVLNSQNAAGKSFFGSRLFKIAVLGAGAFGALFVVLFGVLIYISTLEYSTDLEVIGLEWQRTIKLEEYKTVQESAWEGEVPQTARVQSKENALHHTDRVPNGTRQVPETYTEKVADGTETYVCGRKNKKNGYFEDEYCTRTKYKEVTKTRTKTETIYKEVPVYRTRYTYLIDKWVAAGEKTTAGNDFNPQWAAVQIDNVRTREAGRDESYNLLCKELGGNNKLYKYKIEPNTLSHFQNGMRLHGKTDFFGKLVSIDEIASGKW